jgi:hypothetical protein
LPRGGRNRPGIPADTADSGEEFRQPDGAIGGGERGEGRGKRGLLIGAEIDGHYSRGISGAFTPASFRFQRERREETVEVMMLAGGSHLSARGREREREYRFGFD